MKFPVIYFFALLCILLFIVYVKFIYLIKQYNNETIILQEN